LPTPSSLQYHLKSVHGIKVVVAEYRQMKYRDPMQAASSGVHSLERKEG
jgi:hypothetical protein